MRRVYQRRAGWAGAIIAAFVLGFSAPASAARESLTGKLSRPGYTVIGLAKDGRQTSVRAGRAQFRLRVRSGSVVLHLRGRDGRYAGPVVIRRKGRRAVMGVRAGAALGRIVVRRGYARVARRLPRRYVDRGLIARARRGVPIGARVFGRVRSTPPRKRARHDRDLDGIPDQLDIDDDGDLVLDKDERRPKRRGRAAQTGAETQFFNGAVLGVGIQETANVNAGSTNAQIDAVLPRFGVLGFSILSPDAVLDCSGQQARRDPVLGGLSYCSRGGTGRAGPPFRTPTRFPDDHDPDGDGMGTMVPHITPPSGPPGMQLTHGATSDKIGTGDWIIERFSRAGAPAELSALLQYVHATTPALVSYSDEGGTANTTISYPRSNAPLPVRANPQTGEVVVTVTLWRPQRRAIARDPASPSGWIDIGGLRYTVMNQDGRPCPREALFTSDPQRLPLVDGFQRVPGASFQDTAADTPAAVGSTHRLSFTINMTRCLASKGLGSFNVGESRVFTLMAGNTDTLDNASQDVPFVRTG